MPSNWMQENEEFDDKPPIMTWPSKSVNTLEAPLRWTPKIPLLFSLNDVRRLQLQRGFQIT
ncbi:hypothetical protein C5167_041067 [Papaver somniferum]|uniref:Uncharacterized protein n=1 Tax=Papaver somniferum TaxID=3469 RepID=A0A4Y7IKY7_PAPSO|nr:hypothetical protein C5167_041067 [Papaver somniferum]